MKEKIVELLDFMLQSAQGSSEFVQTQAPLYVQEYLAYHMFDALFGLVAGVILLVASVVLFKKTVMDSDDFVPAFLCPMVASLTVMLGSILTLSSISQVAKNKIAPRVVIVDHVKDQIKELNKGE